MFFSLPRNSLNASTDIPIQKNPWKVEEICHTENIEKEKPGAFLLRLGGKTKSWKIREVLFRHIMFLSSIQTFYLFGTSKSLSVLLLWSKVFFFILILPVAEGLVKGLLKSLWTGASSGFLLLLQEALIGFSTAGIPQASRSCLCCAGQSKDVSLN